MASAKPYEPRNEVLQLTSYDQAIASGINTLLVELDPTFTDQLTEAHFNEYYLENPDRTLLYVLSGDLVAGTCSLQRSVEHSSDSLATLFGGFVTSKSHEGRGVGRDLWEESLSRTREFGASTMLFETEEDRERAIAFYDRAGAVIIGKSPNPEDGGPTDPRKRKIFYSMPA